MRNKSTINILLISSASLLLSAAPSLGASLTFTPPGTQLDNDPIDDIQTSVGALQSFTVNLNTAGLADPLLVMSYNVQFDPSELLWVNENIDLQNRFTAFIDAPNHNPGFLHQHGGGSVPPNFTTPLDTITFSVLPGLINDGGPDFSLSVAQAITRNPITGALTDVTAIFTSDQEVSVQPAPEPASILGLLAFGGLSLGLKRKREQAQKKVNH